MRSIIRFFATLPFPVLFAWTPAEPPQSDSIKGTKAKLDESTAAPALFAVFRGFVGENRSAFAGPRINAGSTTVVSFGRTKENCKKYDAKK